MQKLDGLLLTDAPIRRSLQEHKAAPEAASGKAERFAFQLNQVSSSGEEESGDHSTDGSGTQVKVASETNKNSFEATDGAQNEIDQDIWLDIVEELKAVVMQKGQDGAAEEEFVISDDDIEAVFANLLEQDTNGKSLPPELEAIRSLKDLVDSLNRYNQGAGSSETVSSAEAEQLNEAVLQASETLQRRLKNLFNDDEMPLALNEIAQHLIASIDEDGQLNTDDLEPLIAELKMLLDSVQDMKVPVSRNDLVAALQAHLQALQSKNGTANEHGPANTDEIARINQLLAQLEQGPQRSGLEDKFIDVTVRPNQLSAAGEALNKITQQFKAQLEAMKSAVERDADSEVALNIGEQTRRSTSEQFQTLVGEPKVVGLGNTPVSQAPTPNMAQARDGAMGKAAEAPPPTTFEVARQTQQIIDILGPGAADRLRERVSVMFNSRTQAAEMRLDPPDLGRLTIRLNMNQEQATVNFQVTTPQAREALEQSLHRLRELLHEQGIALADANVSEQQSGNKQEHTSQASNYDGLAGSEEDFSDVDQVITVESPVVGADGSVDYYA